MKLQQLAWPLTLLLSLLVACKDKDNTNIVVEVWSDLPIPSQLNRIRIDLPDEKASSPEDFAVDNQQTPVHLALVPRAARDASLTVRATGLLDDRVLVWQMATVRFVPGKSKLLKLSLDKQCADAGCKSDQFCTAGVCSSEPPPPLVGLPDYDPKAPLSSPDAGARSLKDGGGDVAGDGGVEAGAGKDALVDRIFDDTLPDTPFGVGGTGGSIAGASSTSGAGGGTAGANASGGTAGGLAETSSGLAGRNGGSGGTTGGTSGAGGISSTGTVILPQDAGTPVDAPIGGSLDAAADGTRGAGGSSAAGGTSVVGGASTIGGTTSTGGTSGAGGTTGTATDPVCGDDNTISTFEEGPGAPVVLPGTGVNGAWAMFHDSGTGTQTMAIEATGDSSICHKYALHTAGSDWASYVGIGITNLAGTSSAPAVYPNTKNYTGIKFRAKVGSSHPKNSPVRFNVSTPWTEGKDTGGSCAGRTTATTAKSAVDCYQHLGRYLQEDYALTNEWKDIAFCFDRDLYPLSLPTNLTNAQREAVAANMLKIEFWFNQGNDWTVASYPSDGKYTAISKTTAFDLWIDDISFFTGDCPTKNTFASTGNAARPFPQNKAPSGGSCAIVANAAKFNTAISQIYARWTTNFVRTDSDGLKVICPERSGEITSESMGYGMLIAAALGDKVSFDQMWSYVKSKMKDGLMVWKVGSSGSAADGDEDIAYALYMAAAQWPSGGYQKDADDMATAFMADLAGDVVSGGNSYKTVYNPSYFSPGAYRKFATASSLATAITKGYELVDANINAITAGFPTDWADMSSGSPKSAAEVGAQVFSGLDGKVYGYDGARVPWRLGLDVCTGGAEGKTPLSTMVSFFATKYDNGDSINFMKAGWVKDSGQPHTKSVDCQGSFIGPMGVAGMAVGGANGDKFRDTAFRTMLDILDYGDFNHTYFPSTVGFLTLLLMSGNFPTP